MASQGHPLDPESSATSGAHSPHQAERRKEGRFPCPFFVKFTLSQCFEWIVESLCLPPLSLLA